MRTSYHHGDLRNALLTAAERLMVERADWTFTLREVARAAGVSHNAPYNHFPDRVALLAAVAARGFDDLAAHLKARLDGIDAADAAGAICAIARAYVGFAAANPARFRLMFSAELTGSRDTPARAAAGQRAYAILRDRIGRGVAEKRLRADPEGTHALTAWSLMHGLATLVLDRRLSAERDETNLDALVDRVAATLVDGLADPSSRQRDPSESDPDATVE